MSADAELHAAPPRPRPTWRTGGDPSSLRVAFISGEASTPGHVYRVLRHADAAEVLGAYTLCIAVEDLRLFREMLHDVDVLWIWRAPWTDTLRRVVEEVRARGSRIVFDCDDLMVIPELATVEQIDAIRSLGVEESEINALYAGIRETMAQADFCVATTEELATYMRWHGKPVVVLPNGFDAATLSESWRIRSIPAPTVEPGILRIGYAAGSRTHQRDFAEAAKAIAQILGEMPLVQLVLFNDNVDKRPVMNVDEFPEFADFVDRIEWRTLVPLAALPEELVRFDVNIVPLRLNNAFCEAKSELKYFEAALVGVPTIASPTGPFRRVIQHGRTGFLAATTEEWVAALRALLQDATLRRHVAEAARLDSLWAFGPERRVQLLASVFEQVRGGRGAAEAFARDVTRAALPRSIPVVPEHTTLFESDRGGDAEVTVVVPLYNYAHYVLEALESVRIQTVAWLDLVVIDDASTDESLRVTLDWARAHAERFNRVAVLRNVRNAGLGLTRNVGFAAAHTQYVLPLDADNRLLPRCCEALLTEAVRGRPAFVYPVIRKFGEADDLMGAVPYAPARLIGMPHIDAMALVAVGAWAAAGGYSDTRLGWEDYDFWCAFAERGLEGRQCPGEPLAEYRTHSDSMVLAITENPDNKPRVMALVQERHPWLRLVEANLHFAPDKAAEALRQREAARAASSSSVEAASAASSSAPTSTA